MIRFSDIRLGIMSAQPLPASGGPDPHPPSIQRLQGQIWIHLLQHTITGGRRRRARHSEGGAHRQLGAPDGTVRQVRARPDFLDILLSNGVREGHG